MFFILFSYLSLSNLGKYDNPYEILGVSKKASQAEIRNAFKKLVKEYGPDNNKDPKAEKKFIKINDAYELLKDPVKRLNYDQTGSVNQNDDIEFDQNSIIQPDPTIESISLKNLDDLIDKSGIAFVLVYSDISEFQPLILTFNQINSKYSSFIHFYKNNGSESYSSFARRFNIDVFPSVLYIRKKDFNSIVHTDFNSAYEYVSYHYPLNEPSFESFMENCFDTKVPHFNTFSNAKKWILSSSDHSRVLIIERSPKPSMVAKHIAAKYGMKAKFATLSNDFVQMIRELKLTRLPEAIIFRGDSLSSNGKIGNFILVDNLNDNMIADYMNPLFVKLDKSSLMKECSDFCIVQIGDKPQFGTSEMNRFIKLPEYSFAYLPVNSQLAKSINASSKQFYLIEGYKRRYALLPNIDHFSEYVSRRNIEKLAMKNIPVGVEGDSSIKDTIIIKYEELVKYVKMKLIFLGVLFNMLLSIISQYPIITPILFTVFSYIGSFLKKIFTSIFCRRGNNSKDKKNNNQKLKTE